VPENNGFARVWGAGAAALFPPAPPGSYAYGIWVIVNMSLRVFQSQLFTLIRVLYCTSSICTRTSFSAQCYVIRQPILVLLIYTAHSKDNYDTILIVIRDSGVNTCKTLKVLHSFQQFNKGD